MRTTALVPAYNEEEGIGDTIESLLRQETPFWEIVIVDDGSTDRTREIALSYGVTVLTPPQNLGSKAKAQNYGLQQILNRPEWSRPDLVLPVDADTVFAPDYVELIQKPFEDPDVSIAAGTVQTRFSKTVWERARWIEYHVGFGWFRPIQGALNAPMVCSGCCSAFRLSFLEEFGGFPERTIVEDIDYTWSQQLMGRKAVYVGEAVAYAAEPVSLKYMRKQLWRWKSGFFQNVRQHFRKMVRNKPLLALWVAVALYETMISPITLLIPAMWLYEGHDPFGVGEVLLLSELALFLPPTVYAWFKRRTNPLRVLANYPAFYVLKFLNFYYDWKAIVNELVLVPLGLSKGLHDYEKGRADTPEAVPAQRGRHRAPKEHGEFVPLAELMKEKVGV